MTNANKGETEMAKIYLTKKLQLEMDREVFFIHCSRKKFLK